MGTLLAACQHVCRVCQLDVPSQITGGTADTQKLLLACAQEAGESLYRRYNWAALVREYTFTTTSGTDAYALPSDFGRFVDGTVWDRANFEEMRGPLSAAEWQAFKSSALGSGVGLPRRWRARFSSGALRFTIDPAVTSTGDTLVFEYVTNQWCESSGATGQTEWKADSDVFRIDDFLLRLAIKWRVLERLGMAYIEARDECEREIDKAIARDGGGAPVLSLAPRPRFRLITSDQAPDANWNL